MNTYGSFTGGMEKCKDKEFYFYENKFLVDVFQEGVDVTKNLRMIPRRLINSFDNKAHKAHDQTLK